MLELSHVIKFRSWYPGVLLLVTVLTLATPVLAAKTSYLSETTYEWEMDHRVLPFWKQGEESYLNTPDGRRIFLRRFVHPFAKAQIVIVHDSTENMLKYRELAYDFYQREYSVLIYDHQGHGRSVLNAPHLNIVHIERFQQYVDDLKLIIEQHLPQANRPLFAFGHAMGAAILGAYMAVETHSIQAALLSAPMLEPQTHAAPAWLARLWSQTSDWLGAEAKPVLIQRRLTPEEWTIRHSATSSLARFARYRQDNLQDGLFLSGVSNRWLHEAMRMGETLMDNTMASRIGVPVFISLAEFDPWLKAESIRQWCKHLRDCRIRYYSGSRHEVWNERDPIRRLFLDDAFAFFRAKLEGKSWMP
jgi:lysophospholipase